MISGIEIQVVCINVFLFTFSQLSSDRCKSTKDGDLHGITKTTCPPAQDGYVNKCIILDGRVATTLYIGIGCK